MINGNDHGFYLIFDYWPNNTKREFLVVPVLVSTNVVANPDIPNFHRDIEKYSRFSIYHTLPYYLQNTTDITQSPNLDDLHRIENFFHTKRENFYQMDIRLWEYVYRTIREQTKTGIK